MNIVEALRQEETKLHRQLKAVQVALSALNGHSGSASSVGRVVSSVAANGKRTMSAAVRARISKKAKARWAKIKAEQAKGKTTK
jgi:hypothetical protein